MRTGSRLFARLFIIGVAFALFGTVLVSVAIAPAGVAEAIPAPTSPSPACVVADNGTEGRGCVPGQLGAIASGTFASNSSFVIDAGEIGFSACADYVSTGCYYEVYSPSIVRCVYLYDDDPTDVRSCSGSFSTTASVGTFSAQRQGSCRGELGSTYVLGGPANGDPSTWWVNRGPVVARCEYYIDDVDIDNLSGPTFLLVSASVDECIEPAGGFGCDESSATLERHTKYAWIPVEGELAPRADFTPVLTGGPDVTYKMTNDSIPFSTGTTTYEWDFGDGTTSTGATPSHRYEAFGRYTIRLTMRSSEGPTRTDSHVVEFEAPDLSVLVTNPDAEFGAGRDGNRYSIGDEFPVLVKLRATEGYGSLKNVEPQDDLLTLPSQLELVGDFPTIAPATFRTGTEAEYRVMVRAVAPGRADVRSTWVGDDSAGGAQGPWSGSFALSVTGLQVEVLPDRDSFKLEDTDEDGDLDEDDENEVVIEVKVTNVTTATITDVRHTGFTITSLTDEFRPNFELVSEPTDDGGTPDDESQFGDIAAGATRTLTWTYRADEALKVETELLLSGNADGATVTASGAETVQAFSEVLLEARVSMPQPQTLRSGQPVRFDGTFTNVTDDDPEPVTVSFAVVAEFSNAFGGDAYPVNGTAGYFDEPNGPTATGIKRFDLEPGESVTLRGIVSTIEAEVASGFRADFKAVVAIRDEEEGGAVTWDPQGPTGVEFIDEGEFDDRFDVTLGKVTPLPEALDFLSCDADAMWMTTYWGCQFSAGVFTMGQGFFGLLKLGWELGTMPARGAAWALGTFFATLDADDAGRQAIIDDVSATITAEMIAMKDLGHEALSNLSARQIAEAVPRILADTFRSLGQDWDAGPEVFIGRIARIVGENLDAAFEALVAARSLALAAKALIKEGDDVLVGKAQQVWRTRRDKGFEEVDRIIQTEGHRAIPESRALPGGVDITDIPKIWLRGYGFGADDFRNLSEITKSFNVNIVFRSRAPESVSLIKFNRALPKPQGIKTKGVNAIDIEFLDYPSKYKARVVHMQPPIDFVTDQKAMKQAADAYAEAQLRAKRPGLDPSSPEFNDLKEQIANRTVVRAEEWVKRTPELAQGLTRQPNGQVGVKVDFDPEFNGLARDKMEEVPLRPIKVVPAGDVNGRAIYEIKLQAPVGHAKAGEFLDVTGDIDFLAILKPDGKVLGANGDPLELAKRVKIYETMQSLLGMQHGESFTIASEKIRAKYVSEGLDAAGGETLLAVTPQQRIVTTYFNDGLSTLKGGPNSQLGELQEARAFFSGIFSEQLSPGRQVSTLILDQLAQARRHLIERIPTMFNLGFLRTLLWEAPDEVSVSRSGDVVRPSVNGELERLLIDAIETGDPAGASLRGDAVAFDAANATDPVLTELNQIIADLEASGVDYGAQTGPLGGRWETIDLDDVASGGELTIAPFAFLTDVAPAGATEIGVTDRDFLELDADDEFFQVGDTVIVSPGTPIEERAVIASLSPFRLAQPLAGTHAPFSSIVLDPSDLVASSLTPLTPARVFETRSGEVTVDGQSQAVGRLTAGSVTPVQITGRGGVSNGAAAVALNVTAIRPSGVGYVTLFPCGEDQPLTSSLNYRAGVVAGNSGIVKLNDAGQLCIFTFADTDLVIDVNAWLAEAPSFASLTPARLAETRSGEVTVDGEAQELGRLDAGSVTEVQIAGRGGVDASADAVALNVTAIRPSGVGYVTLYPCDEERPTTSSLNYSGGGAVGNSAVVSLSESGTLCVFTFADTDLVLDVNAWLADDVSFDPFVPARFFETRSGQETVDGDGNGVGRLDAGSVTPIQVAGRGDVPDDASAVALNVTAVRPDGVGYITLFPCDGDQPLTSSLNYAAGGAVGNSGIVKLSADGTVCAFTRAATDLVIDVNAAWTN